jgi:hypothetical protein
VHSYNEDGTVAATMQERPRDLFERVFGSLAMPDNVDPREWHMKRSVLDAVVDQYRHYTGNLSPLGSDSKATVADHLDRIREFEKRAYSMKDKAKGAPDVPPHSNLLHGGEADPGGEGIDITLEELTEEWRLMADLYALAIKMDRVRFGALTFLAAGERIRLTGDYEYEGRQMWKFDDTAQHNATGSQGCSHEWWHQYNEQKKNEAYRAHNNLKIRELAYYLKKLDGPDAVEAYVWSLLDNSLISISRESGVGRHNNVIR